MILSHQDSTQPDAARQVQAGRANAVEAGRDTIQEGAPRNKGNNESSSLESLERGAAKPLTTKDTKEQEGILMRLAAGNPRGRKPHLMG
jgi:hypothetical protein